MGSFIAEILLSVSELILHIQEFFFRKKREKRRELERKEGIAKKRMISPYQRLYFLLFCLVILMIIMFSRLLFNQKDKKTTEKISELKELLEDEKQFLGFYPKNLQAIVRNNPLRVNLMKDAWQQNFEYKQLKNGTSYILVSAGKDGKLNTEDDIE